MRYRIESDIEVLNNQIARLETILDDPGRSTKLVDERIKLALELEKLPIKPGGAASPALRVVNELPTVVPAYFQGRQVETQVIAKFLREPSARLMTIVGREGRGKTALACRVLKELESGSLPDSLGSCDVSGIVYLSETGSRRITFENLYDDLLRLIEPTVRDDLEKLGKNANADATAKLRALLLKLPPTPIVVLLDNFEDLLELGSLRVSDVDLIAAIRHACTSTRHALKLIVTSRFPPADFEELPTAVRMAIALEEGLPKPYAENVLREMDVSGHIGFRSASDALLGRVREFTGGFPRALESFFAILSADPYTSIEDLLTDSSPQERIVNMLVGEAYNRLAPSDQLVMQALAVYGHAVGEGALDFLLEPWLPHVDCAFHLTRLAKMRFVRREGLAKAYFLHPVDREYALSRLSASDSIATGVAERPFGFKALQARAADYYDEIGKPRDAWKTKEDVAPHIRQFELRLASGSDTVAAEILVSLRAFLVKRGAFNQLLALGVQLEKGAASEIALQVALRTRATALWRIGRIKEAVEVQDQLIANLAENDEEVEIARLNRYIYSEDDEIPYEERIEVFERQLQKLQKFQPWSIQEQRITCFHISSWYESLGYMKQAREYQETALELAMQENEPDAVEAETHNLGAIEEACGNSQTAFDLYYKALGLSAKSGNPLWKANHLSSLADCYAADGDYEQAVRVIKEAIAIRKEIGDLRMDASDTNDLARYLLSSGDTASATRLNREAFEIAKDFESDLPPYYLLAARIELLSGRIGAALSEIRRARDRKRLGQTWAVESWYGAIALRAGMASDAESAFQCVVQQCDLWLSRSTMNPAAFAFRGFAHAGLYACRQERQSVQLAVESYLAARALGAAPGTTKERLQLFGTLQIDSQDTACQAIIGAITGSPISQGHGLANNETPERDRVFFCYCREDADWLKRLLVMLAPAVRNKTVQIWYDKRMKSGSKWRAEISKALARARVGVLLVSPDFLNSDFISDVELPYLLDQAERNNVEIVWVLLKEAMYELTPLADITGAHDLAEPLSELTSAQVDRVMKSIARKIKQAFDGHEGADRTALN